MSYQKPTSRAFHATGTFGQQTDTFDLGVDNRPPETPAETRNADEPWITAAYLSPIAMRITDTRAQVMMVNHPWTQSTGMGMDDAQGLGWLNRVEEKMRLPLLERLLAPVAQERDGFTVDYNLLDDQNQGLPVREVTKPRFGPTGIFLGHVSAIVDLSNSVQSANQHNPLDAYDPTLSAASAIVYDIAPPLTAALSYNHAALTQLNLDQGAVATKAAAQLVLAANHLKKTGDMLRRLREVLNKGQAYFDAAHLDDLIREATSDLTQECTDAGVNIQLDLPDDHALVMADPLQVRKVMHYLLTSAIECVNGMAGPKISIQLDQDPAGLWRVCIRHNGTALRDQHEETVFSTQNPVTRGQTGLGLAISQSIIRGHNGRLWYDGPSPSERQGSWRGGTFTFVLPPCRQS